MASRRIGIQMLRDFIPRISPKTSIQLHFCNFFNSSASATQESSSFVGDTEVKSLESVLHSHCGFSESQVSSLKQRKEILFKSGSAQTAKEAVNMLMDAGLSNKDVQKIILQRPQVLGINAQQHLEPKLELIKTLGLNGEELAFVVSSSPRFLVTNLETTLHRNLKFLKSILGFEFEIPKTLKNDPWVMICDVERQSKPILQILKENDIKDDLLTLLVSKIPKILCQDKDIVKSQIEYVKNHGVMDASKAFVQALYTVNKNGIEKLDEKFCYLTKLGLNDEETSVIFRKSPLVLSNSIDKMGKVVDFLVHSAGLPPKIVVSYPNLLSYSLETRIKPRHRVLKELSGHEPPEQVPSLVTVLPLSDKKFLDKYIKPSPYVSKLLQVYRSKPQN
eukprot:TRINITY_DN29589_c0_g1_i1.p1 TRINITY_DN29589_c0_g1~~TRINITY_DN29589_c0_g1_i1.p1  ORF type:complete len:441 (-),score=42.54 TRINITY_DN29589_c0_g1_i1:458-1630(-)